MKRCVWLSGYRSWGWTLENLLVWARRRNADTEVRLGRLGLNEHGIHLAFLFDTDYLSLQIIQFYKGKKEGQDP